MQWKLSLRVRGALAFFLTAAVISALFAFSIHEFIHDMEVRFIHATLGQQLEHFIDMVQANPNAVPPTTTHTHAFVSSVGSEDRIPPYMRGLGPGSYDERFVHGREHHVMVRDYGGKRYYVSYDATLIEPYEHLLHRALIFTPILFGVLSLGLGYWLSGLIITPVTRLAGQVDQLSEDGRQAPLATEYSSDEVGHLAASFDSYAERLEQFAEREKEFTSDVSHELRTSIAIMRSTIELLFSEQELSKPTRKRLRRLEQAVRQMNELVTVFLILAREPQPSEKEMAELCPVEPVLREAIDNRRATLECKGLKLRTTINGNPEVRAPATVLAIVLGDVLDNAIAYTERGQILITLDAHGVTIADTGVGIPWQEQPHIFERAYRVHKGSSDGVGLGLYIVKRLCERYGWRIDLESIEGKGTQMRFVFVS